jgi:hypothetical protein
MLLQGWPLKHPAWPGAAPSRWPSRSQGGINAHWCCRSFRNDGVCLLLSMCSIFMSIDLFPQSHFFRGGHTINTNTSTLGLWFPISWITPLKDWRTPQGMVVHEEQDRMTRTDSVGEHTLLPNLGLTGNATTRPATWSSRGGGVRSC